MANALWSALYSLSIAEANNYSDRTHPNESRLLAQTLFQARSITIHQALFLNTITLIRRAFAHEQVSEA